MRQNMQKLVLAGSLGVIACVGGLTGCASADRSSGQVMDDMMLSRRVSGALNDSPIYKFEDVDVKAYNGVVQLSGWAMSNEQKGKAADIAKNVRGVREVINNISLKAQAGIPASRTRVTYQGGTSSEVQVEQSRQQSQQQQEQQQQKQQQQLNEQQQQLEQQQRQLEQQRQEQLRREQLTP